MADLRLVSTNKCQLKPLVEGALSNELRLLEAGIRNSGIPGTPYLILAVVLKDK